jgi:hypothetical protein
MINNNLRKYLVLICTELVIGLAIDFFRGDLLLYGLGGVIFFVLAAYTSNFFIWKYAQARSLILLKIISIIIFIILIGLTLFYGVGSIVWSLAW